MRITGGERRGQVFSPLMKKWPTRPTTDIAKEALYNILTNRLHFEDIAMLDLFGGVGSHAWEVLSRGCRSVVYVEQYYPCVKFVSEQAKEWDYSSFLSIVKGDVQKFLQRDTRSFDFIFADPPYELSWMMQLPAYISIGQRLNDGGILVIEHDKRHSFAEVPRFLEERKYGMTRFSFFS